MSRHRLITLLALTLVFLTGPARPSHAGWQVDGAPISTAASRKQLPAIVSDGAGGAIVAWVDTRGGNQYVYAQRVNAAGVPQWTANGVPLCSFANNEIEFSPPSSQTAREGPSSPGTTPLTVAAA